MPVSAGLDCTLLQVRFQNDADVDERNLGKAPPMNGGVVVAGDGTTQKILSANRALAFLL